MPTNHRHNGRTPAPNGTSGREYPTYVEHHHYNWGHPIQSAPRNTTPPAPKPPTNYMKWVVIMLALVVIVGSMSVIATLVSKPVVANVVVEPPKNNVKAEDKTPNTNTQKSIDGNGKKNNNVNVGDNNKNTNVHVGDKVSHTTIINQTQKVVVVNKTIVQPVKVIRVPMNADVNNKGNCDDLKLAHEVRVAQWQRQMKN